MWQIKMKRRKYPTQNQLSAGAIIGVAVGIVVPMMMVVAVAIVKCYGRPSTRHIEDIELSSRGLTYSLGSLESRDELVVSTMVNTTTGVSQWEISYLSLFEPSLCRMDTVLLLITNF